jgi:uroporphyrinogen decarboxylase
VNARERVMAALSGKPVDRVPISFWGHHYVAENSADGLAEESLRQARRFEWDFLKPQSRAQAFAEMWGLTYIPSRAADQKYTVTRIPFGDGPELARLRPADPDTGALSEQIEALRTIRSSIGPDVPIIWTVFSQLMVVRYLLPGDATQLLEIARSDSSALANALAAITETLVGYVQACIRNGADGIFYATNLATRNFLTPEECARFQRPYDLSVLAAADGAPFNVLHICGQNALFDQFENYPADAFSFALGPGNPSLAEWHRRTGKASMGGIPNNLHGVSASAVAARARAAIDEMNGRWLLLAPGCSIEPGTRDDLLLAARDATRG